MTPLEAMTPLSGQIETDFVVLSADKRATIEHWDDTLYERLNADYADFAGHELIACHSFDSDWPTWEIHPNGDEIVVLLEGEATFVLQVGDDTSELSLARPGEYVVVPRNTWHTAKIAGTAKMLFITPGQGTENRPV